MLMFRRTHERLMAAALAANQALIDRLKLAESLAASETGRADSAERMADRSMADYSELARTVADFADRSLPPPRITSVQQPKSITEADTNAAKKLRGVK